MRNREVEAYCLPKWVRIYHLHPGFYESCRRIERDENFDKEFNPENLLQLILDENGMPRDRSAKAHLIQPIWLDKQVGKLYRIYKAYLPNEKSDDSFYPWQVGSISVLVKLNGDISFHLNEFANKKDFSHPVTMMKIEDYLGQECLLRQEAGSRLRQGILG